MTELIKVGGTINSMTSLQIAEVTGKDHKNVLRDIRSLLEQGINPFNFALVNYTDAKGEKRPMFQVTKKGCLILASGYDALLREKIINRWEELETKAQSLILPNFTNPVEAARAWANEYEQKQIAQQQVLILSEQNNRLVHSKKLFTTTEIAKELGFKSAIEFNQILCNKGIQFKQNNTWILYSKYADKGYVSIKQELLDNGRIIYDRKWTGVGRDFLLSLSYKDLDIK